MNLSDNLNVDVIEAFARTVADLTVSETHEAFHMASQAASDVTRPAKERTIYARLGSLLRDHSRSL